MNKTINELTALTDAVSSDELIIYDVSTNESKKITKQNLLKELQAEVNGKQNTLTFDSTPTENSTHPVTSGGVFNTLSDFIKVQKFTSATYTVDANTSKDVVINISQISGYTPIVAIYKGNSVSNAIVVAMASAEVNANTTQVGFWLYNVAGVSYSFTAECFVIYVKNL